MDEHLYWAAGIHPRWVDPAGWAITRKAFFGSLRGLRASIVPHVARHTLTKELWGHGMGRHRPAEIYALACADITALAEYLSDKPFFHGDRPTTLDAVAYAYIANIIQVPIESPAKAHALTYPNLDAYCRRMKEKCYGG
jgi:glutathione S-transferase